jgi:hypothetical protein
MPELDNMKIDWVGTLSRAETDPGRPFLQPLGQV